MLRTLILFRPGLFGVLELGRLGRGSLFSPPLGLDFETVRMTFGGYKSYCKKFNYSVQYECTNANFEKLACENMVSMGTSS